jgi:hypothetical protein
VDLARSLNQTPEAFIKKCVREIESLILHPYVEKTLVSFRQALPVRTRQGGLNPIH